MLIYCIKHAFIRSISAIKNFTFPVQNKFLQIQSHSFSNAEILCILGYIDLKFLACAEKMVNSIPAGKNNSGIILYFDLLFTELLGRNSFQTNEGVEIKFHIIFSSYIKVCSLRYIYSRLGN